MLTPEQIRRRLEHACSALQAQETDSSDADGVLRAMAIVMIIDLLEQVLPSMAEGAQRTDDAGRRHRDAPIAGPADA